MESHTSFPLFAQKPCTRQTAVSPLHINVSKTLPKEKTLWVKLLIFQIYLIRPSPFCQSATCFCLGNRCTSVTVQLLLFRPRLNGTHELWHADLVSDLKVVDIYIGIGEQQGRHRYAVHFSDLIQGIPLLDYMEKSPAASLSIFHSSNLLLFRKLYPFLCTQKAAGKYFPFLIYAAVSVRVTRIKQILAG